MAKKKQREPRYNYVPQAASGLPAYDTSPEGRRRYRDAVRAQTKRGKP